MNAASPLKGVAYGRRAYDLCRFVDDPSDDAISRVVRAASTLSSAERDAVRAQLDAQDCESLLTFSRRRAASGIRNAALTEALDAVAALTLVTLSKIDFRDLSVDFPLYAVGRLGGHVSDTATAAAAASEPGTSGYFESRSWGRLTLKDCLLLEVESRYGLGFMDVLSGQYAPQTDLAEMAIRIADFIDGAGRYVVEKLHASTLPAVWLDPSSRRQGEIRSAGCVSVRASTDGGSQLGHELLLFLAEVGSAATASSLAAQAEAASKVARPRVAGSRGRVLLLLIGGASTLGPEPIETTESLRFVLDDLLPMLEPA